MRLLVAAGCLALIVKSTDGIESLGPVLGRTSPALLIASLVLITLDRVLMAYKWIRLLYVRGHRRLGLLRAVQIYCASMVWGLLLPATLGADAIRVVCTRRLGIATAPVLASVVVERLLGLLATPLFALLGMVILYAQGVLKPELLPAWWIGTGLLALAGVTLWTSLSERGFEFLDERLFSRFPKLKLLQRLRSFHQAIQLYNDSRRELAVVFALTLGEQFLTVLFVWVIAKAMLVPCSLLLMVAAVPLAHLAARVPVSIGGLGIFEGVFVLVLSLAGIDAAESLAVALAARLLQLLAWMPWWLTYVIAGGSPRAPLEPADGGVGETVPR